MLFEPVKQYVSHLGFNLLESELQFYESKMDLYGFSEKLNRTIAIELKLLKWKKAIRQALRYQLCADQVYVAMPRETEHLMDLEFLKSHGIGFIGVTTSRCYEVLSPASSSIARPHYRDFYIEHLSLGS